MNWLDILFGLILLISMAMSFRRGFTREIIGLISAVFALLLGGVSACATAPANLGDVKNSLSAYHASGAYDRDLGTVDGEAQGWLRAKAKTVARPALVLDIDETSLSNWPQIAASGRTVPSASTAGFFPSAVNVSRTSGPGSRPSATTTRRLHPSCRRRRRIGCVRGPDRPSSRSPCRR